MGIKYEDLEELCETVGQKITETNDKIRMSNGDLTGGDIDYVDKLTHTLKSIKTTMAMMDAENDGYSHDGRMSDGYSGHYGMGNNRYYPGYSYARGRNARRDSMGRYSRGYSRGNDEMLEQVRDLMEQAPDDQTKREFQKILDRLDK